MKTIEKILEDLTKKEKESLLNDVDFTRARLINLAKKHNLDAQKTISGFNYMFNLFTEKNLERQSAYYSIIDGLYAAKKLMIKYVEAHGKNETN